eukprot:gene21814-26249_t
MPAFGDIGKACKDLLGGFQYDQKVSVGSKTASGVTFTAKGKKKGEAVDGDIVAEYKTKGVQLEGTINSSSKLNVTSTFSDLAPGLKCVLSGALPDKDSGKLAFTYVKDMFTFKGDIGLRGSPKIAANVCAAKDGVAVGGSMAYDSKKGCVTAVNTGVQYAASDYTVALDTNLTTDVKVSYMHKVSKELTVGGEIGRKCEKSAITTAFTIGGQYKLEGGALTKATLNNSGLLNALYQQELRAKTTGIICAQIDTKCLDKGAKFGLELKVKP